MRQAGYLNHHTIRGSARHDMHFYYRGDVIQMIDDIDLYGDASSLPGDKPIYPVKEQTYMNATYRYGPGSATFTPTGDANTPTTSLFSSYPYNLFQTAFFPFFLTDNMNAKLYFEQDEKTHNYVLYLSCQRRDAGTVMQGIYPMPIMLSKQQMPR
jgi:hypothetical protein